MEIKFRQIWKTIEDYKITAYSDHIGCIIPKGTRIIVLNTPMPGALGFYIMPLTSKGLDKKLVPNLKEMELHKEGFGVAVTTGYFKKWFVIDENQKIEFDNKDAEKFWETIVTHNP